jgi:type IV secretion system protein TrbL
MVVFSTTISTGFDALTSAVNGVFGLMIALVVALTGLQWALSPNREMLASAFGKVLLIGFFAYLINDWQGLSQTLWIGFIELGLAAGGSELTTADFLNPGAILQQGWEIVKALGEAPAPVENYLDVAGNLTDALILGFAMIGIMLAFAVLALQIIVTLVEFKIVTLGGFVLLPFGIWSRSAFLAERPLGFVASSGLKVLALAIVVSGARSVFDQLQPSENPDLYEALAILSASILLAMLAIFIPSLASALVTGGPSLGAGAGVTGALAIAGGGALAATGAARLSAAAGNIAQRARSAAGFASGRATPSSHSPSLGPGPGLPQQRSTIAERGAATSVVGSSASGSAQGSVDVEEASQGAPPQSADERRSAALQAFFAANAGRSLLPAAETSGTLAPSLKSED